MAGQAAQGLTKTGMRKSRWPRGRLRVDLDQNLIMRGHVIKVVQPRMAEVMSVLSENEGSRIVARRLATKVYGARLPEYWPRAISTLITRLRKVIEPMGYEIESMRALNGAGSCPYTRLPAQREREPVSQLPKLLEMPCRESELAAQEHRHVARCAPHGPAGALPNRETGGGETRPDNVNSRAMRWNFPRARCATSASRRRGRATMIKPPRCRETHRRLHDE